MRTEARAVVIGGGVGGCSILYHLAKPGWKDVVLVEQYGLTHGSTWHSAGPGRPAALDRQPDQDDAVLGRPVRRAGARRPTRIRAGTSWAACGWHRRRARYEEIQRQAGWAKSFGLPIEIVSAREAQELFPPMSTDGVLAAAYIPQDGYLDPSQLTFALADGARLRGAEIEQRTRVTGITCATAACTR